MAPSKGIWPCQAPTAIHCRKDQLIHFPQVMDLLWQGPLLHQEILKLHLMAYA